MERVQFRRGLTILVVATALLAGCADHAPSDGSGADNSPSEGKAKASDGEKVDVVDKGISATSDSDGEPMASYAAVLENPSRDVAGDIRVEIEVTDKDGEAIEDKVTGKDTNSSAVYFIAPGERQAVSGRTYLESEGAESVSVKVTDARWFPGDDARFQELTATQPQAKLEDDELELDFTVASPFKRDVETVATYAVFRNRSGDIVGGSSPTDVSQHSYGPGDNEAKIDITAGLPSDIDDSSIEIYVNASVKELE